ncbi:fimbrial chaperone [Photobacterium leiognathi]|uniref:fimbrial chaperone n=1 Tax=Photobacterium leiognathi TaxID=553611 RepID=UPI00298172A7|nr:fimbrial chaperone [Photobacterium leiognathi]
MNLKKILIFLALCFFSQSVFAAFILNGTRYIYDEGRKNISIEVSNESKDSFGGQVWIDNIDKEDNTVSFIPLPTFFKVDGEKKQIIRIMKTTDSLPADKESLFWLNVQEIPPLNKTQENAMVIAVNTQVKLIYRPKIIEGGRKNAEQKIEIHRENNAYFLKNPTPYYFAILNIKVDGKLVKNNKRISESLAMFAPKSAISLGAINLNEKSKITIDAIDDYGAKNSYLINLIK